VEEITQYNRAGKLKKKVQRFLHRVWKTFCMLQRIQRFAYM